MIKVSVVVPVYNQEAYLRDALESLKSQTLKEIEFIIVNDGSNDASLRIIKEYSDNDERFIVIDQKNGGVANAINNGNRVARGEYIAELDSDDYVSSNIYEVMYENAKKYDLDIIKCNLINFTGSGLSFKGITEKVAPNNYYDIVFNPMDDKNTLSFPMYSWVSLYRRDIIVRHDIKWNEGVSSYNDNGFFWLTMTAARRVMYIDQELIFHRRDNEMSTVKNPEKMFKNFFIEHAFIRNKLKEYGIFEDVKSFFFERKIKNYMFALNVIPFDKKEDFFKLVSADFTQDIQRDGLLSADFLDNKNKQKVLNIVGNYERYFREVYLPENYKVSVIIPVHNAENHLRSLLDGLLSQTLRQVEFILVENGSTDRSIDIIRDYQRIDPRIHTVSIGTSNAGHARNVGLEMAHGEYVIFLDADDEHNPHLLHKVYSKAKEHNAEIVIFDTCERNVLNGLEKPHRHAFNVNSFPKNDVFSFSQIKGNPFDSVMGWPWDKLLSKRYVTDNRLKYQEINVSNDGFFNLIAMANAKRIVALNEKLVTRLVGHGGNISSTRHDQNPDNQLKMLTSIYNRLVVSGESSKVAKKFSERSIRSIQWMFSSGFNTKEGAAQYFDLIVGGAIDELRLEDLSIDSIAKDRRVIWKKIIEIKEYQKGEYDKFISSYNGKYFKLSQKKNLNNYPPNTDVQHESGVLIFGQIDLYSNEKYKPWFNIVMVDKDQNNVSAIIDVTFMGHFRSIVQDTLFLSISLQRDNDGNLKPSIHQASWEHGHDIIMEHIKFSFVENVFTVYAKYSGQYTGFKYQVKTISTREPLLSFSVVRVANGFNKDSLIPETQDMKYIRGINSEIYDIGRRCIFRTQSPKNTGCDILKINLKPYQFNNIVISIDVIKAPNNRPAIFDTLYLGLSVDYKNTDGELTIKVFQAEWLHNRNGLRDSIYYHIHDTEFSLGASYFEQWAGYNFKVSSIIGREAEKDYSIYRSSSELIEKPPEMIPEGAIFINKKIAD